MNSTELRENCADKLLASIKIASHLSAFVGLDGFVDEIIHAVDKRDDANSFHRIPTISKMAERIAAAAGRSTNVELVTQQTKLGGNGPIMANALATFGLQVTYLGALGYPTMHPVFKSFSERADVHTMAEAGHTDALEFEDGKLLFGKLIQLQEVNWANIKERYRREKFAAKFASASLVGFVNWTMLPHMSDIWEALLRELCPALQGPRRKIFFDLADPEKRTREDILRALDLISKFQNYFDVILGVNEKEAHEIAGVLGVRVAASTPKALADLARDVRKKTGAHTLLVHPVSYALAVSGDDVSLVQGPHVAKPFITTGAGDHFNSGCCLAKLLGFDNPMTILVGVATSGFYVRSGQSPTIPQLVEMLRNWPND